METIEQDQREVYRIPNSRIIYLNGPINDENAQIFNIMLLQMEHENNKENISVYINSPGGSVSAGLSMIDTMNLISCKVSTLCVGLSASMGAVLLLAGTKGLRKILPHGRVLLHQPMSGFSGMMQASDLEIMTNEIKRTKHELNSLIAKATGKRIDKVCKDCDRDYWLNAKDALEYGIVDTIVEKH